MLPVNGAGRSRAFRILSIVANAMDLANAPDRVFSIWKAPRASSDQPAWSDRT